MKIKVPRDPSDVANVAPALPSAPVAQAPAASEPGDPKEITGTGIIGAPPKAPPTAPAVGRYPRGKSRAKSKASPIPVHAKARNERPAQYPERFPVPDDKLRFSTPYPAYAPKDFTAQVVLDNHKPGGWADPPDPKAVGRTIQSYTGSLQFDDAGRPQNPAGRTGLEGRGLLGRWGPNFAADPIVTRTNADGVIEMLAIQRKDSGEWAIPGGMVDEGESVSATLSREFLEETGVKLEMSDAVELYKGYADDRRNTDHAWMETTVCWKHLSPELAKKTKPTGGDEADVKWMPLTPENVAKLYGDHRRFVEMALARFA